MHRIAHLGKLFGSLVAMQLYIVKVDCFVQLLDFFRRSIHEQANDLQLASDFFGDLNGLMLINTTWTSRKSSGQ